MRENVRKYVYKSCQRTKSDFDQFPSIIIFKLNISCMILAGATEVT